MSGSRRVDSISDVPAEFMECRAWREHLYGRRNDKVTTRNGRVVKVVKWRECVRCGYQTWVTWEISRGRWTRVKAASQHPDDYMVRGGVDTDAVKTEYLNRLGYRVSGQRGESSTTSEDALAEGYEKSEPESNVVKIRKRA